MTVIILQKFEILKFLCENGCPLNKERAIKSAVRSQNLEIIKYLREKGCK